MERDSLSACLLASKVCPSSSLWVSELEKVFYYKIWISIRKGTRFLSEVVAMEASTWKLFGHKYIHEF